ncbi:dethiobiotin synthase [Kitasatospora xanthocidica]|uniref:dethiobiotin synthase n=1 Tax=Kitasatospora xanthocidica TaxID=83382 RepID=UPI0036F0BDE7
MSAEHDGTGADTGTVNARILFVTGTNTDVGKTVATAALASAALRGGLKVAVLKPGQTGVTPDEPGDADEVRRLAGELTYRELARYPEPLAPDTAARRSGLPYLSPAEVVTEVAGLAAAHDLVLVEGAGGLLVRYDDEGRTLADQARAVLDAGLPAEVLLVASAGLGTLNIVSLTAEALAARELPLTGVLVGSWPADPGLAERCNLADLPRSAGAPLLGALPERAGTAEDFAALALASLAPELGGTWNAQHFADTHRAE